MADRVTPCPPTRSCDYHSRMADILNIAAYRFVPLHDLQTLRRRLLAQATAANLRGTILLAPEGINLFLAGAATGIARFLAELQQDARFARLETKESWSDSIPFRRLRVRLKREIIRMNHPTLRPANGRAAAVDALTVRRWLDAGHDDQGRPVVMLDTRNRFELQAGRFHGAVDLELDRFSDFPAALQRRLADLEGKTVVSYCTGGIRCEKAALWMDELGMQHHWQLDGGILRYFETVGGDHFEGTCTVFDERSALDPTLQPVPP